MTAWPDAATTLSTSARDGPHVACFASVQRSRAHVVTSGLSASSDASVSRRPCATSAHVVVEKLTPTLRSIFGTPHSTRRTGRSFMLPHEDALAVLDTLVGLAEHRVAPERPCSRHGEAQLDARVANGGALGQEIGRVDADVAHLAGDAPALVDRLDRVAGLELREIGVRLRRARRRVGEEDAAVLLEDATAQDAHRVASVEERRAGLRVRLDVGGAHHATHVEHHEVHEAGGLDVVALLVREHRRRGVREQRAALVVVGDALGDAVERGERIVAGRAEQAGKRGRGVARDGREATASPAPRSCP